MSIDKGYCQQYHNAPLTLAEDAGGTALFRLPPQTLQKRRGDFPEPQHIGFAHVGFTSVDQRVVDGRYDFLSDIENSVLDVSSYCQHHGYTYIRVVFPRPEDRMWGFGKALGMTAALQNVELLIVCDFDVAVMDFYVPIETILARWGFQPNHLVLAAEDPDRAKNKWESKPNGTAVLQTYLNIGFMVLRNHEKVFDSLELWNRCVDLVPGCEQHRWGGYVPDQAAWNKFILPTFLPSEVLRAPCNESNGYNSSYGPNNDDCEGLIISHAWGAKAQLGGVVRARILRRMYRSGFSALRRVLTPA